MKKKIYLIQPTYRNDKGILLKGKKLYIISLSLPAISAITPGDWEKEFCYEYFDEINFDTDASVIGISSMGYDIFRGVEIAEEFKRRGKKVIFGGFQPRTSSGYLSGCCDSVIYGNPGKPEFAKILKDAELNCLQKEYFCKTDLNYKFDYSVLDSINIGFTPVLLSVGCYNKCGYCIIASIFKGNYKLRKLKHVLDELDYLHKKTKNIAVVDTNFYNNRDYIIKLCNEMIRRKYKFIWGAQSSIDIGDDKEALYLLKKSGCKVLFIGLESVDQKNLDEFKKKYTVESYEQRIKNIHKAGIRVMGFFMYGLDNDTTETARLMSNFITRHRIAVPMLNVLVPMPGTDKYNQLKSEDRILLKDVNDFLKNNPEYNSSFNLCFYKPKLMTPEQVEEGFIELLGRLSSLWKLAWRSIVPDIKLSIFFLYNNWMFRKEYYSLKRRRKAILKKS